MFPVSNKSQDIVDTLVNTIKNNNVEIKEETVVNDISKMINLFIVKHKMANLNQNSYYCDWWNKRPQTGSR